jgi:hypothetical protein
METFNGLYCTVLRRLEETFDGHPDQLGSAIGAMFRLAHHAKELMAIPLDGGGTAGPSFEYVGADTQPD